MRRFVIAWLSIMLVFSSIVILIEPDDTITEGKVVVENGVTYTTHAPIRINSNADFDAAHGVTGGSGTQTNPWIIEGWDINGAGFGCSLFIGNTTEFFIVRNCNLHNASGNSAYGYWNTGLIFDKTQNFTIENNELSNNVWGIYIDDLLYPSTITNNRIFDCNMDSIQIEDSANLTISDNILYNNEGGITLVDSNHNLIKDNTMEDLEDGIIFISSSYNNVSNNNVARCTATGIYLNQFSIYNSLFDNVVNSSKYGITLERTHNNTLLRNKMSDNDEFGLRILSYSPDEYNNSIDTSNEVNDKPVYYIYDQDSAVIDGVEAGHITIAYSENVVIQNLDLEMMDGIRLSFVENCSISSVNISSNLWGIYTAQSSYLILEDINIFNIMTNDFYSVHLSYTYDSKIDNVSISNSAGGGIGLFYSNNNEIKYCNVHDNIWSTAFYLEGSDNNVITKNSIVNNGFGLKLDSTDYNLIYHNNVHWNSVLAGEDYIEPYTTNWDNGYPSGGNYWSDYTGQDEFNGVNQDIPGSDGIGDEPGWMDNYPLMNPVDLDIPISWLDPLPSYWFKSSPLIINVNSFDESNEIEYLSLWYKFSYDNETWNNWTEFDRVTEEFSYWTFDFPSGDGYYEFYSVATDNWENTEKPPSMADAICAFDSTGPYVYISLPATIDQNSTITLDGSGSTDLFEIINYTWSFAYDGVIEYLYGPKVNFSFDIPGFYNITLSVEDMMSNVNASMVTLYVLDTVKPHADAGPDQTVDISSKVIYDWSGCTDNCKITNCTWSFTYNNSVIILYGFSPSFTFWTAGDYIVTLNVTDEAGNWDIDTMTVYVNKPSSSFFLMIVIIAICSGLVVGLGVYFYWKPSAISDEATLETALCQTCGFAIEPGQSCPYCSPVAESKPYPPPPSPRPPPPPPPPPPNQEMLDKVE